MAAANDNQGFDALTFGLHDQIFAVDANAVREIRDVLPITPVSGARDFAPGLINVRGRVVPLADLRVRFGMGRAENSRDSRIIVIETQISGEPTTVGILADRVYEVSRLGDGAIEDTPSIGLNWRVDFVKGIGKRDDGFVIIPDIERILSAD